MLRMIRTFDAPSVYRSATSQLDVLLPLLTSSSPSPGQLPPQTSQRVITLHLPSFPQPSPVGRAHFMRRPHDKNLRDFDELVKYFQGVTWQTPHTRDQNLMRLLDLMECFVTRIALEGFFVSQVRCVFERGCDSQSMLTGSIVNSFHLLYAV